MLYYEMSLSEVMKTKQKYASYLANEEQNLQKYRSYILFTSLLLITPDLKLQSIE